MPDYGNKEAIAFLDDFLDDLTECVSKAIRIESPSPRHHQ